MPRRTDAAAETRDVLDRDVLSPARAAARAIGHVARGQPFAQLVAAVAVARHVAAHAHFRARRRREKEVRIETGDRLQSEERHAEPLRERPQFRFRQVAVGPLDAAELVEDGGGWRLTLHEPRNISGNCP